MLYLTNSELKGGYLIPPKECLGIVFQAMEDVMNYKKAGESLIACWICRTTGWYNYLGCGF